MATPFAKLVALLKPKRRWAQFSLRTLFVLVGALGALLAWLGWKLEQKRQERAAVASIWNHTLGNQCVDLFPPGVFDRD